MESAIIEGAKKKLEEFKQTYFPEQTTAKSSVVSGYASEEILNYAKLEHIDLIIMGTHGRKGIEKIMFGSVADRVIKTSPVPVLIVNPYKVNVLERS